MIRDPLNLFTYAASELSQDAFLAWLLAHADPNVADRADPALRETAVDFFQALLRTAGKAEWADAEWESVEVHAQRNRIDVSAEITFADGGPRAVLIIEDKVRAKTHGDQLERYRKAAGDKYGEDQVAAIWLKTHDQAHHRRAEEARYSLFLRRHLLETLRRGRERGVTHQVYQSFLEHLERIEREHASFADWDKDTVETAGPMAWAGLFSALQRHYQKGGGSLGWGRVNNASGGFMGLWMDSREVDGVRVYLQLEEQNIVYKIRVPEKDSRRRRRTEWHGRVVGAARTIDGVKAKKPGRFGHGQYMTVALLEGGYLRFDGDRLDLGATLDRLDAAQAVLEAACAS